MLRLISCVQFNWNCACFLLVGCLSKQVNIGIPIFFFFQINPISMTHITGSLKIKNSRPTTWKLWTFSIPTEVFIDVVLSKLMPLTNVKSLFCVSEVSLQNNNNNNNNLFGTRSMYVIIR